MKKENLNSIIYLSTDFFSKIIPFLLIPIITTYLSPIEYGEISIINIIIEITTILILLAANTYYRVEFFKVDKDDRLILLNRLISNVILNYLIITILLLFINKFYPEIHYSTSIITTIALFQSIIYIYISYFQCKEKSISVGIINISFATLSNFLFLFLIIKLNLKEDARYYSYLISVVILCVVIFLFLKEKKSFLKPKLIPPYYRFGFEILPHAISWWARNGIERLLIANYISIYTVGVYSLALQFISILVIVSNALNQAYMPAIMKSMVDKNSKLTNNIIKKIIIINIVFCLSLSISSYFILPIFINKEFSLAKNYLSIMALSFIFQAIIAAYSNIFYFYKKNKQLSIITFISSLLNIMLIFIILQIDNNIYYVILLSSLTYLLSAIFIYSKANSLIKRNENDSPENI